jgi:hypothetical protein
MLGAAILAGVASTPAVGARHAPAATDFSSSLEPADPQPDWTSTVETDSNGNRKASGVSGTSFVGIPGSIRSKIVQVTASSEYTAGGEVKENLIDGDVNSKWLAMTNTGWVAFKLSQPVAVVRYALTSANDLPNRDPQGWQLQGSPDGSAWTTVDTRSGESFSARYTTNDYTFTNTQAYLWYRLNITANHGDADIQLAELQLSDGSTTTSPASDMNTLVGGGPSSAYTAKTNAGWTGLKALQYSGSVTATGRGYSWNKAFAVNLPVTSTTQLSYLLFPEFTGADLRRPSTYASVDLAFSDGTYLSDLGAKDQHGFTLSPHGQGV